MGKIVLLDELTINQIAAGEVIERPASVVKEMIENSVDAGAKNITIEIKNGGISYIRISDDGKGIARDDVELAFERHATSKIRSAADLQEVKSMGFRGEALASIAAIANVELISKTEEEETGTKIDVEGGKIVNIEEVGCTTGTVITVKNLFYNTPVRYKFLKKDFTETGYIEDVVNRIALIHPEVALKLISGGKTMIQTVGNNDLKTAVYSIFGREVSEEILPVSYEHEYIKVKGAIGKPAIARSNRANQIFFVNDRYIKDKTLSAAAEQAYKGIIPLGKFAFLILNVEMDPKKVDVNVHPAKLEVRFAEENVVFQAVYHAIKNTLLKADLISDREKSKEIKEASKDAFKITNAPTNDGGLFGKKNSGNYQGRNSYSSREAKQEMDVFERLKKLQADLQYQVERNPMITVTDDYKQMAKKYKEIVNSSKNIDLSKEFLKKENKEIEDEKAEEKKVEKVEETEEVEEVENIENKDLTVKEQNLPEKVQQDEEKIEKAETSEIENKEIKENDDEKVENNEEKVIELPEANKTESEVEEVVEKQEEKSAEVLLDEKLKELAKYEDVLKEVEEIENIEEKNEENVVNVENDEERTIEEKADEDGEKVIELPGENEVELNEEQDLGADEELPKAMRKEEKSEIFDNEEATENIENQESETEEQTEEFANQIVENGENTVNVENDENKTIEEKVDAVKDQILSFEAMYRQLFGKEPYGGRLETEEKKQKEEDPYQINEEDLSDNISVFEDMEEYNKPTYKFIGIAFKTYIILEMNQELYIMDQHAAHERILYEKVKANFDRGDEKESQMLLIPDIINLTNKEMDIARDNFDLFESAGFVVEEFGDNTVKVSGVPDICIDLDTKELFLETLDEINTVARTAKQEKEERFIATIACKAAVKANMALTEEEVNSLMEELLKLPNPFSCPHGRPTVIKMSKIDIERKFERK